MPIAGGIPSLYQAVGRGLNIPLICLDLRVRLGLPQGAPISRWESRPSANLLPSFSRGQTVAPAMKAVALLRPRFDARIFQ
jgi:hypothetical protein